jgi:transcriptional regulator with XRE-family HTH domain
VSRPDLKRLRPATDEEKAGLRSLLGARCRQAREELGISGRQTAGAVGMCGAWIRGVERGEQFAPAWYLVTLSEVTGKPIEWFYRYGAASAWDTRKEAERAMTVDTSKAIE